LGLTLRGYGLNGSPAGFKRKSPAASPSFRAMIGAAIEAKARLAIPFQSNAR
jgi:hypothetical protein